jgi:WD40 repeat protein
MSNSDTYIYDDIVSVKYNKTDSIPIHSFIAYNKQLWISASCIIYIININNKKSYDLIMKKPLDDDHLLTMLGFSSYIWAGSARGNVFVFRMDNYELLKTFHGHNDGVYSLCSMLDTYVISGSGQDDTSIIVWDATKISNNVNTTSIKKR